MREYFINYLTAMRSFTMPVVESWLGRTTKRTISCSMIGQSISKPTNGCVHLYVSIVN